MNEKEELTSSCATSEPSFYNASYHLVHAATLMHDETYVIVLNFFHKSYYIVEHFIVEPSLDLSLPYDDLLDVSCDKDDLADNASVVHVLNSHTCAEIKHVIHIANTTDERQLQCSTHTLGYIEFDILCNLDCL
jgi:hypothetical protein